jgi:pectate lyase
MKHTTLGFRRIVLAVFLTAVAAPCALAASFPWRRYSEKPDDWFRGSEGAKVAENVLSYQADNGDWPKNIDTSEKRYEGDRAKLSGTFDNGATVGEMRFLARAYRVTDDARYRDAFYKALDLVLAAQYPNGGFPQTYPPGTGYPRYITFNDNTMVNLLDLLRDVSRSAEFKFVDAKRRASAARAFDSGIGCILRCQIKIGGRPTVWCAQHDEKTLEPRGARTYELPSLSGAESAGILLLLMNLDGTPTAEIANAVRGGARWFESAKLRGIRQVVADGNKVIVPTPNAPLLWARFYEIDTGKPFFCGRDGVKKYDIAEIEAERRNGYAWYGEWGNRVSAEYAKWQQKWQDLEY